MRSTDQPNHAAVFRQNRGFRVFFGKTGAPLTFLTIFAAFLCLGCSFGSPKKADYLPPAAPNADGGLQKATRQVVAKLKNDALLNDRQGGSFEICFLGVQGKDAEPIPALSESVRRQITEAGSFRLLDNAAIEEGLKSSGVKRNDIYIPENREKLTAALGRSFDYILSGRVISTPASQAGGALPAESVIFELYSVRENATARVQQELSACYLPIEKQGKFLGLF